MILLNGLSACRETIEITGGKVLINGVPLVEEHIPSANRPCMNLGRSRLGRKYFV